MRKGETYIFEDEEGEDELLLNKNDDADSTGQVIVKTIRDFNSEEQEEDDDDDEEQATILDLTIEDQNDFAVKQREMTENYKDKNKRLLFLLLVGATLIILSGFLIGFGVGFTTREQQRQQEQEQQNNKNENANKDDTTTTLAQQCLAFQQRGRKQPFDLSSSSSFCVMDNVTLQQCLSLANQSNCHIVDSNTTICPPLVFHCTDSTKNGTQIITLDTSAHDNETSSVMETTANNSSFPNKEENDEISSYYVSPDSALFSVQLPLFSRHIVPPGGYYNNRQQLIQDVTTLAQSLVNQFLLENIQHDNNNINDTFFSSPPPPIAPFSVSTRRFGDGDNSVSSFSSHVDFNLETNDNKNNSYQDANLLKSDGTFNYVAYGNVLLIWRAADGTMIHNITFSPHNTPLSSPISARISIQRQQQRQPTTPRICSIVLLPRRLILFVEGYSRQVDDDINIIKDVTRSKSTSALDERSNTRIFIYDTSTLPTNLILLHQRDVSGDYRGARAFNNTAIHVVTTAPLRTRALLFQGLQRSSFQVDDDDDDMYLERARHVAQSINIPNFVETLVRDLDRLLGNNLDKMARICLWQLPNQTNFVVGGSNAIRAFTLITSIHVPTTTTSPIRYSSAGAFTPSHYFTGRQIHHFVQDDNLVLAVPGWTWNPQREPLPTTFLMGFQLSNNNDATPRAVGTISGHFLNHHTPYTLRDGRRFVAVTRLVENKSTRVQVTVLEVDNNDNVFREVARLKRFNQVVTAVRFFDNNIAIVMTMTYPFFYVLDLTNPLNPSIVGQVNANKDNNMMSSQYVHSINHDNNLLVAVGQDLDTGNVQILILDATNLMNPIVLDRHIIGMKQQDTNVGRINFKAIRLIRLKQIDCGILLLPLRIDTWDNHRDENFNGFRVLNVTRQDGIQPLFNITHHDDDNEFYSGCIYSNKLVPSSLVSEEGNVVTTLKEQIIVSTRLDSGTRQWTTHVGGNDKECLFGR